jgi:hypothetical protein
MRLRARSALPDWIPPFSKRGNPAGRIGKKNVTEAGFGTATNPGQASRFHRPRSEIRNVNSTRSRSEACPKLNRSSAAAPLVNPCRQHPSRSAAFQLRLNGNNVPRLRHRQADLSSHSRNVVLRKSTNERSLRPTIDVARHSDRRSPGPPSRKAPSASKSTATKIDK